MQMRAMMLRWFVLVSTASFVSSFVAPAHKHGGQHRSAESNRRGTFSKQCQPYPNKRVVLVTVNSDFMPMFTNWFHFAKDFLQSTEQLYVISEDDAALQPLHKLLDQSGVEFTIGDSSGEVSLLQVQAPYNSAQYGDIAWKRPQEILKFLRANCTVLYSDVDNVWAKDPFRELEVAGSHDLYLTRDSRPKRAWGYCGCFMYLHPTAPIIKLMDDWAGSKTGLHNQPLFNSELQKSGVDFGVLPFDEFPPGFMKVENATVFHANWVIGEEKKVQWLRSRGLWWVNATA